MAERTKKIAPQVLAFRKMARKLETQENENAFNAALKAFLTNKDVEPTIDRLADELGRTDPNWTKNGKLKRG